VKLAVFCDYLEEDWPSMDLVADMLIEHAARVPGVSIRAIRPKRRLRLPRSNRALSSVDRLFGRLLEYPLAVSRVPRSDSWFHIADHSYAHVALLLPRHRTGIFCHDADAFRPALAAPGTARLRGLARVLLSATRRAAVVFHSTDTVRRELIQSFGFDPERLVAAPYGVPKEFQPAAQETDRQLRPPSRYLLHVGSLVPRKNPSFLLETFARCRRAFPDLLLVQVGGTWTVDQEALVDALGVRAGIVRLHGITRSHLAVLYRGAAAVLVPSVAEGFGLPLIEALSCGALVIASDLPVLREVAGDAAVYLPVSDHDAWGALLRDVLLRDDVGPHRATRLARAALYTWDRHARTILTAYERLR
jgi:glycosyltransferase involved in cell wall biosynthesis